MPAVSMQRSISGPLPRIGRNEAKPRYFAEWDDESRTPSLQMANAGTAGIREHVVQMRQDGSDPRNWALSEGRRVYHKFGVSQVEKRIGLKKRPSSATSSLESSFEETKRHIEEFFFRPYFGWEGGRAAVVPSNLRNSTPPIRRMTQRTPTRWVERMQQQQQQALMRATDGHGMSAHTKSLNGAGSMPQVPTAQGHLSRQQAPQAPHAVLASTIKSGSLGYLGHQKRR